MIHTDCCFSGHFPKCTQQIKKGLPCNCVAEKCKVCLPFSILYEAVHNNSL